jgi:hypothetical protein
MIVASALDGWNPSENKRLSSPRDMVGKLAHRLHKRLGLRWLDWVPRSVPELDRARLRPIGRDVSLEGRPGYRPPTVTFAAPLQFLVLRAPGKAWVSRKS